METLDGQMSCWAFLRHRSDTKRRGGIWGADGAEAFAGPGVLGPSPRAGCLKGAWSPSETV